MRTHPLGPRVRSLRSLRRRRRAFSLIEMLMALTISATLLTAMLVALDFSFKRYRATSESASMHVVGRLVAHRILSQIRTGTTFGPTPADVLDPLQNPVVADQIEFIAQADLSAGLNRITRFEFRPDPDDAQAPGALWLLHIDADADPAVTIEERMILSGVRNATFTLSYNTETWLLDRAEIDLNLDPPFNPNNSYGLGAAPDSIRLVASATPRQLQ
jgi:prepilin-type N-terminal cleavage/methylation domain-containing protein